MEVIKNKRNSRCGICRKDIKSDYKVSQKHRSYHLRCYFNWLDRTLKRLKDDKKKMNRYKKHMILEALE
jgi:hypothetical protein